MASILNATTSTGFTVTPDNSGSLQLATNNGTTAVTINTSQNVGVGTSSPSGKLHVEGGTENAIIGSSTRKLYFRADGSGVMFGTGASQAGNGIYFHEASNLLYFQTNSTERMRIDSSGNLLVATSSVIDATYTMQLAVATNNGFITKPTTNKNYNALGFRNSSNTEVGYINCTSSATSFGTSSDYRLKHDIAPMTGALEKVSALKPVTYKWNVDGSDGQGFIAHELAEVCPDAVTGEKDAVETYTDENGNEQTRIKPQGIDTSFLVATLTAAIQELKAELDATKAEVQALKGTL